MKLPRYSRRFASLVLVVTVTGYWGFSGDSTLTLKTEGADADPVDSYLVGANIRQFDEQGRLTRTLRSPRIEHLTASDSNLLHQPVLVLRRAGKPPLQITAQEAEGDDGNQLIELRRDVHIEEQAQVSMHLRTEQLFVNPDSNFAWTREPVAYYRGKSTTMAVGMNAYLDQSRVELLNEVKGHYETR